MLNHEQLLELTLSYLKSLVAEAIGGQLLDFDGSAPFGELGIDSFRVLKLIKTLEEDFGTLPKTLLFEYFNVESLARYFADKHGATLSAKFSTRAPEVLGAPSAPAQVSVAVVSQPAPVQASSLRVLEKNLPKHPELQAVVAELSVTYRNEGGASRGTRNIAPNLFIGSAKRGYFNYSRTKNLLLVYAYTGPSDYFTEIAGELNSYCNQKAYQLNIFTDQSIGTIDGVEFSATPFGALQRVLDIRAFSLEGGAMRRLRYQVSKFEKAGACRTVEYRCGTDPAVDQDIARVIDLWCATKPMVNPLVHIVKEEILAARLDSQHRLFLTYLDDVLQNAILLSPLAASLNGYLMDLEFYSDDMPLGGLEYAIVNIISALAAEGCNMLSLGGTYGIRLTTGESADPEVDRILDDLHKQKIFNDEGNLQFKNKFRPENRTIYLCRPVGGGKADNVIDIIMMIADPAKAQTSDEENHNVGVAVAAAQAVPGAPRASASEPPLAGMQTGEVMVLEGIGRSHVLADAGFNPINVAAQEIEFDLKTDSWAQLETEYVARRMANLRAQLHQPLDVESVLKDVFGFSHCLLTDSGATAEQLLCKAWPKRGLVPQNMLFPSGIFHQIDQGFTPRELPHPQALRPESSEPYKGNINLDALREQIARHANEIAFVCIEVCNNASGGHPVSIEHLREVKTLLAQHSIALVIDGTRVLENAQYLIDHAADGAGKSVLTMAREILAFADIVTGALTKDFGINRGGMIATNDEALFRKLQDRLHRDGGRLDVIEKKLIGLALLNHSLIERQVQRRTQAARTIWEALRARGVPVVEPAGGHCVLIDVKRIAQFAGFAYPVASFLAWLYLNTGIRAGAHSVGMQKNSAINDLVRLAIPVGLKPAEVEELVARLTRLFDEIRNIPEIAPRGGATEAFGNLHVRHGLIRYHHASSAVVAAVVATGPASSPILAAAPVTAPAPSVSVVRAANREIAIVGMAGRYPKSASLDEFWDNLRQGRDCVGDMPANRFEKRVQAGFNRQYRGGFIEAVDKFDSLFFNISPREAELLDPQERLFLEVAWEAVEDAGYYPEAVAADGASRNVGVFVGAVWAMYQIVGVEQKLAGSDVNPNSFLWSIANRVSYWMNLNGPSLSVDTACSSSLTAIHLACEAIRQGECSSAIVGGVNLDLHQHKFDINSAGGALSPDGTCRTFGAGANGYVAGEGVGALFIKPLDQALQDRDHIYGVIKGVTVNHGGRTSGYTVPSPKAQGEVIAAALIKAGVAADTIGYIEAHGTGTELGDPIEISGLTNAFESSQIDRQSCPIGSVKTNIGHLEAAAGVVGVSKVLLQMKYAQIVPSLHSAEPNTLIDFEQTPFYVPQQLQAWTPRHVGASPVPLRAGVSSFGAGGANAHIVLEAYPQPLDEPDVSLDTYLFPLSARNDEQLREMAARLHTHLQRDFVAHRLTDIAYTLQNGRKSFEHRMVVLARSQKELLAKLDVFLAGKSDPDVLTGHAKNADGFTKLLSREEKGQFVSLLAQGRDPHRLAKLWLDGLLPDCKGFMLSGRRTSLPTYPFADKRHWIVQASGQVRAAQARSQIHPLIDSNESTFKRQLFKKAFRASDFFLRDHVVSDIPTLPGTAYLDLARKAGELAAGRKVRKIRNVTWISPLTVQGSGVTEAFVELKPSADTVAFEVFAERDDGSKTVFAQGKLIYETAEETAAKPEHIDLAAIRARCTRVTGAEEAYPLFKSLSMHYGPSFQVVREVYKSDDEVLGLLELPQVREADFEDFVFHPCLLDASMQAGIVAQLGRASGEMRVPYSLGEVEVLHPLTRVCYSYLTKSKNDRGAGSGVSREDVTIVDESGKVLARIRETVGVALTRVHEKPVSAPAQNDDAFVPLYYTHEWETAPCRPGTAGTAPIVLFDVDMQLRDACVRRGRNVALVLRGEQFEDRGDRIYVVDPRNPEHFARLFATLGRDGLGLEKICYAWPEGAVSDDEAALDEALERGVYGFLSVCQGLIECKPSANVQLLYAYFGDANALQPHNEAINGFVRTLHLENPRFACQVLEIRQAQRNPDQTLDAVLAEFDSGVHATATVRYEERVRHVRTLKRFELAGSTELALRHKGVYLITGGAGGLGLIFAEHLSRLCQARLVLTGRSALSAERQAQLDALVALGAEVLYLAADVSKADDVRRVVDAARARFGGIDGIIHGAGVLRDSLIRKKTRDDMHAVFAPKVHGSMHLDQATRDEKLDFFVLFSSLAALGGNMGQCDYAFANHFMDSFAARREALRAAGMRSGHTLSFNWSLWAEGGMQLDEQTELFFRKTLGIRPLTTEEGLAGFVGGLSSARSQIAVLCGVQAKIEQAWGLGSKEAIPAADEKSVTRAPVAVAAGGADLYGAVVKELVGKVTAMLKLDAADLSLDAILLDLGFDSIGLTTFANAINETYGLDVNPVLFFEFPSINARRAG
ncbi:polyketide synthase [Caballeronia udeis]|uniref:Polyketide synthase n=1 Tax=Caballeronia udeis TaxID=1232866 RepID=A0A158GLP5_9BURK|nr:SDR family NAD(P)-dependent oxidoreductase [Caballeronia udeis]SAL32952.1 polyketide synthase [Caballeronia udeis]